MKNLYLKIIFLLLIPFSCGVFFAVFKFKSININLSQTLTESDTVEISEISLDKIIEDEYGMLFYADKQMKRKVVRNNNTLSQLQFSPLKDKYGFMENLDVSDVSVPYDRQVLICVGDINTMQTKEIYHGSFKTSGWEWFSNEEILVSVGCGTECQVLYLIDLTEDRQYQLQYGVGYEWSPDKTKVLGFHYTENYGIEIGDKTGQKLFSLLRKHKNFDYSGLSWKTKASWSPNSNKLALIIKKENEEKLELMVFDIVNDFDNILQTDIENLENIKLAWNGDEVLVNGRRYIIE